MTKPYWRGIPVDRLPDAIWQPEYTRLCAAIDLERERIQLHRAIIGAGEASASGEPIGASDTISVQNNGDDIGETIRTHATNKRGMLAL